MKRTVLVLLIAASLLLAGCRKTNDSECNSSWHTITAEVDWNVLSPSAIVNMVMDQHMLPNTVGEYLQQCLSEGYRPPGL